MTTPGITVITPTIAGREGMLARAVRSVREQTLPAEAHLIVRDEVGAGAALTRNRALTEVATPWVAMLDDDDWMYPEHLEVLAGTQAATGADYVFSYYSCHDSWEGWIPDDPLGTFGRAFDPAAPHQTTITILVRSELMSHVGGYQPQPIDRRIPGTAHRWGEDWQLTLDCVAAGAHIVHAPRRTWAWRHHGRNTSGRSELLGGGRVPKPRTAADPARRAPRIHRSALGLSPG